MTESVLQFGAGRFLRGFVDRFIAECNRGDAPIGKIVVVQSTPGRRAELLNEFPDGYPVVVCGIERGQKIEREVTVDSISRALIAGPDWSEILTLATSDDLRLIVSNATEAGYRLSDGPADQIPETLPGKLTAVLHARFAADRPPLTILPCELISANADRLCELVLQQADRWELGRSFAHYVSHHCLWLNNLVDCIVSDLPESDARVKENPLAIMAEPYALLAVESSDDPSALIDRFPLARHAAVDVVPDLAPFYLRKVRVLNGIHTAMVSQFLGGPLETVQDVLADRQGNRWTRDVLYGEILPTLLATVEGAVAFVDETLDRFANPYLAHRLTDIRLNHEQKVPVRLIPTADDYQQLFGHRPRLLQAAIDKQVEK
jgi:tagaturonate reductase